MSKISAKTILYSIPEGYLENYSLITLQLDIPYFLALELLTHKRFSRNASSNRALSISKNIEVLGYYIPDRFYLKGKGMNSGQQIDPNTLFDYELRKIWNSIWDFCSQKAIELESMGIAKEQASRVLPAFKMMKYLVTGTYDAWKSFLSLRDSPDADIAMQELAKQVRYLVENPVVEDLNFGKYHIPFLGTEESSDNNLMIASGRIARVSYLSESSDNQANIKLGNRLLGKHMSPFEHVARWDTENYPSSICSKYEDICFEKGFNAWTNLRAYYETNGKIEGFISENKGEI